MPCYVWRETERESAPPVLLHSGQICILNKSILFLVCSCYFRWFVQRATHTLQYEGFSRPIEMSVNAVTVLPLMAKVEPLHDSGRVADLSFSPGLGNPRCTRCLRPFWGRSQPAPERQLRLESGFIATIWNTLSRLCHSEPGEMSLSLSLSPPYLQRGTTYIKVLLCAAPYSLYLEIWAPRIAFISTVT